MNFSQLDIRVTIPRFRKIHCEIKSLRNHPLHDTRRIPLTPWLATAAAILAVWFWYDSMRARERTLDACRHACRRVHAQLLDETVAIDRMRLARYRGQLVIARRY